MANKLRNKTAREHDSKKSSSRVFPSTTAKTSIITLLTDFGTADYFVAAMKGRILSASPGATIVDITHEIPPQDIQTAAFTLLAVCETFPPGTIHVAVVDPGVGSLRKPIALEVGKMLFVGPDNGIFSYILERFGPPRTSIHLNNDNYFSRPVSPTFHGRDVFAPIAAALSQGVELSQLGSEIRDIVRLPQLKPTASHDGKIDGRVIHIDRFGNCITNLTERELTSEMIAAGAVLHVKGKKIKSFRSFFAEDPARKDRLFAVWGSAGFLEIAATNDSAARILKAKRGDTVTVRILAAD